MILFGDIFSEAPELDHYWPTIHTFSVLLLPNFRANDGASSLSKAPTNKKRNAS